MKLNWYCNWIFLCTILSINFIYRTITKITFLFHDCNCSDTSGHLKSRPISCFLHQTQQILLTEILYFDRCLVEADTEFMKCLTAWYWWCFFLSYLSFYNLSWLSISLTCRYHRRLYHLHMFTVAKVIKLESSSTVYLYYVNIWVDTSC